MNYKNSNVGTVLTVDDDFGDITAAASRPSSNLIRATALTLTLVFGLLGLILLAHPYRGIYHDAILYAVQATRDINPQEFATDIFFRYGSPHGFTIFSAIYVTLIQSLGLETAAHVVSRISLVCFLGSGWLLARRLMKPDHSWLALALLIVVPGSYGAFGVFSYGEDFATPRCLAEGLILLSVSLLLIRQRYIAFTLLAISMSLHPLMAVPGLLLTVFWISPLKARYTFVSIGLVASIAVVAIAILAPIGRLVLVDPQWRHILEAQVPYIFINLWSLPDWHPIVVTLVTLVAVGYLLDNDDAKKLAVAALVVSSTGMVLAAFSSYLVPLALLLQGQPWRWLWLGKAIAVLLLVPMGFTLWRRGHLGRSCLALFIVAWSGSGSPVALIAAICGLFSVLNICRGGEQRYYTVIASISYALASVLMWSMWHSEGSYRQPVMVLLVIVAWVILFVQNNNGLRVGVTIVTIVLCGVQIEATVTRRYEPVAISPNYGAVTYGSFASWRAIIRPGQTVLFPDKPAAVWLLLHRLNYVGLTDVLFSRSAALKSQARFEAIYSIFPSRIGSGSSTKLLLRSPLNVALFNQLCRIPDIDFLITRDRLPLPHLLSTAAPPLNGYLLYGCNSFPKVMN